MPTARERDLINAILLAVTKRWPRVRLFRNSVGMVRYWKGDKHRVVRYGLGVGSADLVGIGPGGVFLAIEVKTPGTKPTRQQKKWMAMVRDLGGIAIWGHTPAQVVRELEVEFGEEEEHK